MPARSGDVQATTYQPPSRRAVSNPVGSPAPCTPDTPHTYLPTPLRAIYGCTPSNTNVHTASPRVRAQSQSTRCTRSVPPPGANARPSRSPQSRKVVSHRARARAPSPKAMRTFLIFFSSSPQRRRRRRAPRRRQRTRGARSLCPPMPSAPCAYFSSSSPSSRVVALIHRVYSPSRVRAAFTEAMTHPSRARLCRDCVDYLQLERKRHTHARARDGCVHRERADGGDDGNDDECDGREGRGARAAGARASARRSSSLGNHGSSVSPAAVDAPAVARGDDARTRDGVVVGGAVVGGDDDDDGVRRGASFEATPTRRGWSRDRSCGCGSSERWRRRR